MLKVTNRKEKKSARDTTGYKQKRQQTVCRILQVTVKKRTNSVCDATGNKQKREQTVPVILHVTNRKDNKQCAGYYT